ncbi:MAG: conjugal transfer protein TraN [Pseudomonadota bacterium]
MMERLSCPEGMCCALLFISAMLVWKLAFPKWPGIANYAMITMGASLAVFMLALPTPANAQTPSEDEMTRDDARQEAEDLADSLEDVLETNTTMDVNPDTVPGFTTDEPDEVKYYDDHHDLSGDALSQAGTHEAATFVNDSMVSRPIIEKTELDEWTENGLAVEADAQSIVKEYTGAYGDCETEVSGGAEETTYTYSCDEGDTLNEFTAACRTTLNVTFSDRYIYHFSNFFSSDACNWEPTPSALLIQSHPGCSIRRLGSPNCGRDSTSCGIDCDDEEFEASCSSPVPGLTAQRVEAGPVMDDWDVSACDARETDPNCSFTGEVCVAPNETRIINGQPITRDCWETERSYACIGLGDRTNDCDPPAGCELTQSECLSEDDETGECRTTEHTYTCRVEGSPGGAVGYCEEDVYCIDGDCQTIVREQNDEFHQAISALSFLGELQNDVDEATMEIFPGEHMECGKAVLGLKNCCSDDGILLALGFSCDPEEEALATRKDEGHCHYVGTYCSNKALFGICLTKKRSYCCFNNVLARIIHQQGRPQIDFEWGDRKEPDCAGFTVAQFQTLDLSVIDFSEFYNDVLAEFDAPDADAATTAIRDRIINAYQCPPNC